MASKAGWSTTLDEGTSAAAPVARETEPLAGRRALVVLGPHRSGTSALTRVLNLCGAGLPAHILPPGDGLPEDGNTSAGFWESKPILMLHEEILVAAGAIWDHPHVISPSWFDSEAARKLTRRLAETLAQEYQDASFIVAKDPRISLLAPLWRNALQELGFAADWVISVRNPLATAASLTRRDGFPQGKGLSLWLAYFLAAERHTRGQRRVFVLYDDLLEDWRAVVERIERELSLSSSPLKGERTDEIEAFLDPSLRHHEITAGELLRHDGVTDLVKDAFLWASEAATGKAVSSDPLDGIHEALQREEAVFLPTPASRVKIVAFYLPQYHPIPENDEWWGEGFTDWTNVTQAQPCFQGHKQPLLPSELGLYDLRLPEVRARQAALAQGYGIYGFCYYYYWFHGKKLLEQPFEDMLARGEPDFPFCLCWANENWTRRWDGEEHAILIAQEHSPESDAAFIDDVMPALCDPRYIRYSGKPLLLVYRADLLADPLATTAHWREAARRAGLPGLHICAVWRVEDPRALGFDALVEFPPHHFHHEKITDQVEGRVDGFQGEIFDYPTGVRLVKVRPDESFPVYRGVMPGWDNTARRKKRAWVFAGSTPELYGKWLERVVREAWLQPGDDDQYVFINAWNEWAEGAALEPSKTYGRRYLEATRSAVRNVVEYQGRSHQREHYMANQIEHLAGMLQTMEATTERYRQSLKWLVDTTKGQQSALSWLRDKMHQHEGWLNSLEGAMRDRDAVLDELRDDRTSSETEELRQQLQEATGLWRSVLERRSLPISRQLWLSPLYGVLGLCLKSPWWLLSGRLHREIRRWKAARRILRSGLFHPDFYRRKYPEIEAAGTDPLYHYVHSGAAEGRDPNPFFSGGRYLERHPELATSGENALLHYLGRGGGES